MPELVKRPVAHGQGWEWEWAYVTRYPSGVVFIRYL